MSFLKFMHKFIHLMMKFSNVFNWIPFLIKKNVSVLLVCMWDLFFNPRQCVVCCGFMVAYEESSSRT